MTLAFQLGNFGALITFGLGLMGLFMPGVAARFTSITPVGSMGVSEIRATYGGLFIAMAGVVLLAQDRLLFGLLGTAWIGAAAGRLVSYWWDRNHQLKNVGAILFELAIGYLCLAPVIASWWRNLFA
jgi:hypothetical protein